MQKTVVADAVSHVRYDPATKLKPLSAEMMPTNMGTLERVARWCESDRRAYDFHMILETVLNFIYRPSTGKRIRWRAVGDQAISEAQPTVYTSSNHLVRTRASCLNMVMPLPMLRVC